MLPFPVIYDRVASDVSRASYLKDRWNDGTITPEEQAEFENELKGVRDYRTLNRIAGNMRAARNLLIELGHVVPPMTSRGDWTKEDIPQEADIAKFKTDISALRRLAPSISPPVPDLPLTHYEKMNNIERILFDIWQAIQWMGEISYNAGAWYARANAGWYFGKSKTIPLPEYPVIVTESLPGGMVGDLYHAQIEVISASLLGVQFELVGDLPPGLTLSGDGVISGRPLLAMESSLAIKATNIAGSSTRDFQIIIGIVNTALRAGGPFAYAGLGLYLGG